MELLFGVVEIKIKIRNSIVLVMLENVFDNCGSKNSFSYDIASTMLENNGVYSLPHPGIPCSQSNES
jgi:hypothetical protein